MEDSSLSESELENKGTSGRNEPAASPAGFSPSSEVHIVSFHGCFPFSFSFSFIPLLLRLRLSAVHLPPFLCLSFTFALWPWDPFKMPPSSSSPPLSDSSDGSECPSFCLSLSLHSLHSLSLPLSLSPSLPHSLSLPISD